MTIDQQEPEVSESDFDEKYYYSATIGFLQESRRQLIDGGDGWPDDAKEISLAVYEEMISGQNDIRMISPDEKGYPVLVGVPEPTIEQKRIASETQKQKLISHATAMIGPLQDAVDLEIATEKESLDLKLWKKYRVDINRIDTSNPDKIKWPDLPDKVD